MSYTETFYPVNGKVFHTFNVLKDCASYYHIHKHTFQGSNKVLIYKVLRICIKVDLQNFKNKLSFLSSQAGWKKERKEKWRILCNLLGELAIKDGVGSAMDHISCNKWVYSPVDTSASLHPAHSNRITSLAWTAAASIICHMFSLLYRMLIQTYFLESDGYKVSFVYIRWLLLRSLIYGVS